MGTECVIGYLHRGVEKIGENRTYAHVRALRGPHGLRGGGLQRPGLLPGGGEAAERGGAAARAGGARHPHRAEPDRQPPALAGHARARHRRHHAAVLLLARARRHAQHLREVLRRAPDHARLPHRRPAVRDSTTASSRTCQEFCDMFLPEGGRVRGTAHRQPHLDGAPDRTSAS